VPQSPDPFPEALIPSVIEALTEDIGSSHPLAVRFRNQHSNDIAEVDFDDGRTLMVKRGRHAWARQRFAAARRAADLLRDQAQVVAPTPLSLPDGLDERPLEVYWRIPLCTLRELWPVVPPEARPAVMRSWGQLVRRIHRVSLSGYGPLGESAHEALRLGAFLQADLGERLLPAVRWAWPRGVGVIERLLALTAAVEEEVGEGRSTLVHNDLHMENVLCEVAGGTVRCVGVLDLEAAFAGPPEADLAHSEVLHGPLFFNALPGAWFEHLCEGYRQPLNAAVAGFFRVFHLVNLGFYAAFIGHRGHADDVARAAYEALKPLEDLFATRARRSVPMLGDHATPAADFPRQRPGVSALAPLPPSSGTTLAE